MKLMLAEPAVAKSLIREVRALGELDPAHELRNEVAHVRIPVAVPVCRHVHRNARHRGGEVRSMIEVEAAQVELIGLPLTTVLADHDAGDGFEDFAGAHDRPHGELARRDRALACRLRDAQPGCLRGPRHLPG